MATESANTHRGVPFFDGIFVNKTGDTTNNAAITLLIKPLIKKNCKLGGVGFSASDAVSLFNGPGVIQAVRLETARRDVILGTADLTFKDSAVPGSGNTILTATNYITAAVTSWYPVTTTGIDDAGAAVTTAATGAYTNSGVGFFTGLNANLAQGNTAGEAVYELDVLIEN